MGEQASVATQPAAPAEGGQRVFVWRRGIQGPSHLATPASLRTGRAGGQEGSQPYNPPSVIDLCRRVITFTGWMAITFMNTESSSGSNLWRSSVHISISAISGP